MPRRETGNESGSTSGGGRASRTTDLAAFLNALDGRALLWMYAQMEDRPLRNLTALQTDQVRSVLALRTEIDVEAWREKTTAFLAGEANEVDWGPFAGLTASNGTAPRSRADAPGTPRQAEPISVNGVPATPGSQGGSEFVNNDYEF